MQICKLFKIPEHNQAIIAIAHIFPDLFATARRVVIFILIGQAVFISAFSLATSDTALFARRVLSTAIRTLILINQDWLTLSSLNQSFGHS